jgi:ABC-type glutathione transport system ATPase component
MPGPILQADLCAGYGKTVILEGVAFELAPGERLGLVGTSGAGKSTLVLALLGLLPLRGGWATGQVRLRDSNLLVMPEREARRLRGREIALVPQSPLSALNTAVTIRTHFEEAWRAHVSGQREELRARVAHLMGQMQLPQDEAFLRRRPGEVSVGQAQRVAIALALLHRPAVLIADEPTSSLDPVTARELLELLFRLSVEEQTSLLLISHDLLSVVQLCDRMAVLHQRRIVETLQLGGEIKPAEHVATRALLATLPASLSAIERLGDPQRGLTQK